MNPTNSLRWRARVTKEAFLHDDHNHDNSQYSMDRWETNDSHSTVHQDHAPRRRRVSTICIDTFALSAVGATVYVLLQWSLLGFSSTVSFVGRALLVMACTLTLILATIVMQQERKQQRFGTLRHVYLATKRTIQSLQQQNERWCRSLTALDRTIDRMHTMEQELRQYTHSEDTTKSIQVIQEYMQIQRRLNEQLQYQIQEHILVTLLFQHKRSRTKGNNQNCYYLSAADWERFIEQLNQMAGIVLVQDAHSLRDILVSQETTVEDAEDNTDDENRVFMIPQENVWILLRRLRNDVRHATNHSTSATNKTTTTPTSRRHSGGIVWLDEDTDALFQFQPRVLLPSTKDLMEF